MPLLWQILAPKASKVAQLKEEIGWLKVVFGIFVATDISLITWLAQNFGSASRIQVLVSLAAVVGVTGAVVWVNRMAYGRIQ